MSESAIVNEDPTEDAPERVVADTPKGAVTLHPGIVDRAYAMLEHACSLQGKADYLTHRELLVAINGWAYEAVDALSGGLSLPDLAWGLFFYLRDNRLRRGMGPDGEVRYYLEGTRGGPMDRALEWMQEHAVHPQRVSVSKLRKALSIGYSTAQETLETLASSEHPVTEYPSRTSWKEYTYWTSGALRLESMKRAGAHKGAHKGALHAYLCETAPEAGRAVGVRKLAVELDLKTTRVKELLDELVAEDAVSVVKDDSGYMRYYVQGVTAFG